MGSRWDSVVVDATDPARLGRWWAEVLDYRIQREAPNELVIAPGGTGQPAIVFTAVTEPKSGKNRLHLDLRPEDRDAEVERLVNMGARHVDIGQTTEVAWIVLADPEGNEFCVLTA
jgi:hypothetical protein